jgi:hypothetical protein
LVTQEQQHAEKQLGRMDRIKGQASGVTQEKQHAEYELQAKGAAAWLAGQPTASPRRQDAKKLAKRLDFTSVRDTVFRQFDQVEEGGDALVAVEEMVTSHGLLKGNVDSRTGTPKGTGARENPTHLRFGVLDALLNFDTDAVLDVILTCDDDELQALGMQAGADLDAVLVRRDVVSTKIKSFKTNSGNRTPVWLNLIFIISCISEVRTKREREERQAAREERQATRAWQLAVEGRLETLEGGKKGILGRILG